MADLHDDLAAHVADELASADGSGQLAPLSEARLEEIRAIADSWTRQAVDGSLLAQMAGLAHDLLDEVTQRREREKSLLHLATVALDNRQRREAALLAVVRAVAESYPWTEDSCYYCRMDAGWEHDSDCTWMQARAALADNAPEKE